MVRGREGEGERDKERRGGGEEEGKNEEEDLKERGQKNIVKNEEN